MAFHAARILLAGLVLVTLSLRKDAGSGSAWAQSAMSLQFYPTQDKISQSKISQFIQDRNGYIWFGTWDGLIRFDGRTTQQYKTYPGDSVHIVNHRIMRLKLSHKGNLWVTTYGKYCYVFDTERYAFFNPLKKYGNTVTNLFTLENGAVWTFDGKSLFLRIEEGKDDWHITPVSLPFEFGKVNEIILDKAGNEWILTDKGAFIYNMSRPVGEDNMLHLHYRGEDMYLCSQQKLYAYDLRADRLVDQELDVNSRIEDFKFLHDGRILLYQYYQVSIFSPKTRELKKFPFKALRLRYTFEDSHYRLWLLGHEDQVYMIQDDKLRTIPYHGNYVQSSTTSFQFAFEDNYGTVWVQPGRSLPLAFYDAKLDRLEQAFTYEGGRRRRLPYYIHSGILDNQNNLWGNIDEVGFCYFSFSPQEFDYLGQIEEHEAGMGARSILLDDKHRLWVGWRDAAKKDVGGITLYDERRSPIGYLSEDGRIVQNHDHNLSMTFFAMKQDSQGRIWLGTRYNGIYVLTPKNEEHTAYNIYNYMQENNPTSLSSNFVEDILEDHLGRIWIGTYGGGLNQVDDHEGISRLKFRHVPGIAPEHMYIRTLCETDDHKLLIGENNGLLVADMESDSLVFFLNQGSDKEYSMASNCVMHISQLRDRRIAVSTYGGGVNILPAGFEISDTLHFEHHDMKHGGVPDVVLSTLQDWTGTIWVLSENSLNRYSESFVLESTYLEGTPCSEATPVMVPSDHCIYLASRYDMLCFLDQEKQQNRFEPQIAFTELDIHRSDTASQVIPLTASDTLLTFSTTERSFTLHFVALDYAGQRNIQYIYRIVPDSWWTNEEDCEWIPLQNRSAVNIAGLKGGDYTLEVRCTNADRIWSNKTTRLSFHLQPFFYERIWFKGLLWILVINAIFSAIFFVMRHIDKRRRTDMQNQLSEAKVKFIQEVTEKQDSPDDIFTKRLMKHIEDNIMNEGFNMEQTAQELGLSYPVLYRKVKTILDMTPVELVRQVRMQRAQSLLSDQPTLSIAEVAYRCGFGSPQYFNRVFKEMHHCTPAEYRKKHHEASIDMILT